VFLFAFVACYIYYTLLESFYLYGMYIMSWFGWIASIFVYGCSISQ